MTTKGMITNGRYSKSPFLKWDPCLADEHYVDPSAIALRGLDQADAQLETAALRIAQGASGSSDLNLDVVDLSAELVALMTAQTLFSANLATLKTADAMQKSLLDVTA